MTGYQKQIPQMVYCSLSEIKFFAITAIELNAG